jgi:hypothetical protein
MASASPPPHLARQWCRDQIVLTNAGGGHGGVLVRGRYGKFAKKLLAQIPRYQNLRGMNLNFTGDCGPGQLKF